MLILQSPLLLWSSRTFPQPSSLPLLVLPSTVASPSPSLWVLCQKLSPNRLSSPRCLVLNVKIIVTGWTNVPTLSRSLLGHNFQFFFNVSFYNISRHLDKCFSWSPIITLSSSSGLTKRRFSHYLWKSCGNSHPCSFPWIIKSWTTHCGCKLMWGTRCPCQTLLRLNLRGMITNKCSAILFDQGHEQENTIVKGSWGAVGLTENPAVFRWRMLSSQEIIRQPNICLNKNTFPVRT